MTEPSENCAWINEPTQRLDKWLWHARFFKTRSLAQKMIAGGHIRVGGTKITSSSRNVKAGEVLTITTQREVKVVKIRGLAMRRGPYSEAATLYDDITAPVSKKTSNGKSLTKETNPSPTARPDKRSRRQLQRLKYGDGERT